MAGGPRLPFPGAAGLPARLASHFARPGRPRGIHAKVGPSAEARYEG
jgi:hypothetical protein